MSFNPSHQIIGGAIDTIANFWYLWHTQTSILGGKFMNMFYTNLMCYPHGVSLRFDMLLFESIISLPIRFCCGPVAAYNFVIFFTYVFTFAGMFFFLRLITKNRGAAMVAALGFAFCAYRLQKTWAGHIDLLQTEWIGFFLYFTYQAFFYRKKMTDILIVAGIFILQAYTDYRTFIFLSFLMIFLYLRAAVVFWKKHKVYEYIQMISLFFILCILGLIPFLFLYRSVWIMRIPLPAPLLTSWLGSRATSLIDLISPWNRNSQMYLGWLSLFLCLFYLVFSPKKRTKEKQEILFWLSSFFIFLTFSTGPMKQVQDMSLFQFPLLAYRWLMYAPILRLLHVPSRFVILMQVALSIVVAYSIQWILSHISSRFLKTVAVVTLALGIIIQNIVFAPFKLTTLSSDRLTDIITHGPNGSVLGIPFGYFDAFRPEENDNHGYAMLQQTIFQKPLLEGYVSYINDETYQWYKNQNLLQRVLECQKEHDCKPLNDSERGAFIQNFSLKYVLVNNIDGKYDHMIPFLQKSFPGSIQYKEKDKMLYIIEE